MISEEVKRRYVEWVFPIYFVPNGIPLFAMLLFLNLSLGCGQENIFGMIYTSTHFWWVLVTFWAANVTVLVFSKTYRKLRPHFFYSVFILKESTAHCTTIITFASIVLVFLSFNRFCVFVQMLFPYFSLSTWCLPSNVKRISLFRIWFRSTQGSCNII